MSTKQWLQVDVDNDLVMHLLLSFISSLDLKPLYVPIEADLGSVYCLGYTTFQFSFSPLKPYCHIPTGTIYSDPLTNGLL